MMALKWHNIKVSHSKVQLTERYIDRHNLKILVITSRCPCFAHGDIIMFYNIISFNVISRHAMPCVVVYFLLSGLVMWDHILILHVVWCHVILCDILWCHALWCHIFWCDVLWSHIVMLFCDKCTEGTLVSVGERPSAQLSHCKASVLLANIYIWGGGHSSVNRDNLLWLIVT